MLDLGKFNIFGSCKSSFIILCSQSFCAVSFTIVESPGSKLFNLQSGSYKQSARYQKVIYGKCHSSKTKLKYCQRHHEQSEWGKYKY